MGKEASKYSFDGLQSFYFYIIADVLFVQNEIAKDVAYDEQECKINECTLTRQ